MSFFYYLQFWVSRAGIEFIIRVVKHVHVPLTRTENRSTHLDPMLWADGPLVIVCFSPLLLFLYIFSENLT
jgi:hypothetical protein